MSKDASRRTRETKETKINQSKPKKIKRNQTKLKKNKKNKKQKNSKETKETSKEEIKGTQRNEQKVETDSRWIAATKLEVDQRGLSSCNEGQTTNRIDNRTNKK